MPLSPYPFGAADEPRENLPRPHRADDAAPPHHGDDVVPRGHPPRGEPDRVPRVHGGHLPPHDPGDGRLPEGPPEFPEEFALEDLAADKGETELLLAEVSPRALAQGLEHLNPAQRPRELLARGEDEAALPPGAEEGLDGLAEGLVGPDPGEPCHHDLGGGGPQRSRGGRRASKPFPRICSAMNGSPRRTGGPLPRPGAGSRRPCSWRRRGALRAPRRPPASGTRSTR